MENYFKLIVSQLTNFWKGLDSGSRRKLIAAGVILLVMAAGITYFATRTEYVVLYSNLDSQEAGEILNKLEEMKVDVKPQGSGTILVPKSQEANLRMKLAAEGYPKSGFNYDYAQNSFSTSFGATDADKKRAQQIQLQDRLQKAIMTMSGVESAIVTLSIPDEDSFVLKTDRKDATASVLLKLRGELTKKQVSAIEDLVAKSVPGLKKENISIVDTNMNTLNGQSESNTGLVGTYFELENEVKDSIQRKILALLEPVFGKGNVIPSVNVRLNFDKQTTQVVRFEPVVDDSGIAVSISELKEKVNNTSAANQEGGGMQTQYPVVDGSQGGYEKKTTTTNYEVNQIKDEIEKAQGKIESLTLSVLINKPELDAETLGSIQNIIATAVGVDSDKVVVKSMSFDGKAQDAEAAKQAAKQARTDALIRTIGEVAKYVLIGAAILFLMAMLYKLINHIRYASEQGAEEEDYQKTVEMIEEFTEIPEEDKEHILKKKKIESMVDSRPELAAQQIREWLNES